jgi:hypothetical protein
VLARRKTEKRVARSETAGPKAGRELQVKQKPGGAGRAMPPMPNGMELHGRREEETYGDGSISAKKRPPGAGTRAIPKKVG